MNLQSWKESGSFYTFNSHKVFYKKIETSKTKSWITFLHGFPTCSWDYLKIIDCVSDHYNILLFDFLGFGLSDKPHKHHYSIHEQADLALSLWDHLKLNSTWLVAHDYGDTVAQELLSRNLESIQGVVMMNGGLYPALHKPLLIQKLLKNKLSGPLVTHLISKKIFIKNFSKTLSQIPSELELNQLWDFIKVNNGHKIYHKLIHYIEDRERNEDRWVGALEKCPVPIKFIWGVDDPISGKHMIDKVKVS